jgi:hypothetical protein
MSEFTSGLKQRPTVDSRVLRLVNAAKRLIDMYPPYRDDPSSDDRAAWEELEMATNEIATEQGQSIPLVGLDVEAEKEIPPKPEVTP